MAQNDEEKEQNAEKIPKSLYDIVSQVVTFIDKMDQQHKAKDLKYKKQ